MKKVVYKLFWAWEFKKEEKWLNHMASKGLNLTDTSLFRYVFEIGTPGEYQYRLELLENTISHPESQQYIRFMEEAGVEQVASYIRWIYFRKKSTETPFEIFSDVDSKIKHFNRIKILLTVPMVLNFTIGLINLIQVFPINAINAVRIGPAVSCILIGALLATGVIRIVKQVRYLKKERNIHE